MIKWCAYCQTFQGETAPYEDFEVTHGMCEICAQKGLMWTADEEIRLRFLQDLFARFWEAGDKEDQGRIHNLVKEALREGIRPIDILFGLTGPILIRVGILWETNQLTFHEEQKYTRSCEWIIDLISKNHFNPVKAAPKAVLANVIGNKHTLGIRFVSMGLASLGIESQILYPVSDYQELLKASQTQSCSMIGLSISLAEQKPELLNAIEFLKDKAQFQGQIVVGGSALNYGLQLNPVLDRVLLMPRPRFALQELRKLISE